MQSSQYGDMSVLHLFGLHFLLRFYYKRIYTLYSAHTHTNKKITRKKLGTFAKNNNNNKNKSKTRNPNIPIMCTFNSLHSTHCCCVYRNQNITWQSEEMEMSPLDFWETHPYFFYFNFKSDFFGFWHSVQTQLMTPIWKFIIAIAVLQHQARFS